MTAAAAADAVVVHDVPLLVENRLAPMYHLVIVVDAPIEQRVRRLVRDRGMSQEDVLARIATQADDARRRAVADVWLDNGGTADQVLAAADDLWADRLVPFEANVRLRRQLAGAARLEPSASSPSQAALNAAVTVLRASFDADQGGFGGAPKFPPSSVLEFLLRRAAARPRDSGSEARNRAAPGAPAAEGYPELAMALATLRAMAARRDLRPAGRRVLPATR